MAVRIDDNHNQPNKNPVRPHQDELAEHAPWFLMTVDAILSQGLWGLTGPDVTKLSSKRTEKISKFLPSVVFSYLKGEKAALYI